MDNKVREGIEGALLRTNMSTYEISKVYKVNEEEVLDIMKELDYVAI